MGASNHADLVPPSLDAFYSALEKEFYEGLCLTCPKSNDVSYLSKQGVLMWNISLITELFKAGSMLEEWEPFMKFFFEDIIAKTNVPVVSLGQEAHRVKSWLAPMQWHFPLSHPASAKRKHIEWDSEGVFRKVQRIVKEQSGEEIIFLPKSETELCEILSVPF